jgi:Rad3-related DNA helicase
VLFALIRGKISEGLDFSDDKCRGVVIIGVPYPARKDIKVISKMQYLN